MPQCSLLLYFGLYVLARIYPGYGSPDLLIPKLLVREVNIFKLWMALAVVLTLRGTGLWDPCEHCRRGIAAASGFISQFQNCTSLFVPANDNF